jgi:hypothetical protein
MLLWELDRRFQPIRNSEWEFGLEPAFTEAVQQPPSGQIFVFSWKGWKRLSRLRGLGRHLVARCILPQNQHHLSISLLENSVELSVRLVTKSSINSWVWWDTPVIPPVGQWRQEYHSFVASLSYIVRPCCLKTDNKKNIYRGEKWPKQCMHMWINE